MFFVSEQLTFACRCSYTILAETVDRIVDSDEVLRAALGMSDRSQSTGTEVPLPVTRSYALSLCFASSPSVVILSYCLVSVCLSVCA